MVIEISVITTSMNYGRYIEQCIKSVIDQEAPFPFKINHVIMDGGSTDETVEVIKKYEEYIHYYVNKGENQTSALNHAMKIIEEKFLETNYIGWLNADDYYKPYWLNFSLTALKQEKPDVAMTCGGRGLIKKSTSTCKGKIPKQRRNTVFYVKTHRMAKGNMICQPTVLIKMSAFKALKEKCGYYFDPDDDYTQDYNLWCRFIMNGFKIRRIEETVAMVRKHSQMMTRTHKPQQKEAAFKVRQMVQTWLQGERNKQCLLK